MFGHQVEKAVYKLLVFGAPLVTVFILTGTVTDPVNVTKFFILCGLAGGLAVALIVFGLNTLFQKYKLELGISILFLVCVANSVVFSHAPISQSIYGVYGRNTGALTYLALVFIFLSSLLLSRKEHINGLLISLFAAGIINMLYCFWVLLFGDFIGWNNLYGSTLGLFGNPDFISAFFGIFIGSVIAYVVPTSKSPLVKVIALLSSGLAFYLIIKSHAIQGVIVTLGGLVIVGFLWILSKTTGYLIPRLYAGGALLLGVVSIAGTLQQGPFSFLYKRSVSLRGTYWRTGVEMANAHPFSGIGMDAYGDWYRAFRPAVALIDTPGKNTTSNAAHNVIIDFFASGGYPLLFSYLAILFLGLRAIWKFFRRNRKYNPVFATLVVAWAGYQIQSVVSINQIGLAIWGWVLTGALIAYEISDRTVPEINPNKHSKKTLKPPSPISPQLVAGIGVVIGLFVAYPPLSADANWFKTMSSNDVRVYEKMLKPSFINPSNSYKYAQAVDLFGRSNFPDFALKYALLAVDFNPNYFTAWQQMYNLPNASSAQKLLALQNMKRLDPKNPDVTAP